MVAAMGNFPLFASSLGPCYAALSPVCLHRQSDVWRLFYVRLGFKYFFMGFSGDKSKRF